MNTRKKKSLTQVSNAPLGEGPKSCVFTKITMFTYIIPVNCNAQVLNGRKSPVKGLGIVNAFLKKTPATDHIGDIVKSFLVYD